MIIREIPEIAALSGVGASSADVSPVYLCGAQALGVGWAKRWGSRDDVRDYGFVRGVAMHGMYGIEKLTFGTGSADTDDLKDHGVVTGFFADVADS
jgi:hypothetical protein